MKINTQGIFCSKENINTQILSHYIKNIQTEPIIIARHLPINKLLIIDGNHRYEAALNRKDQFINCIILEPTEHLPYLISDRMKTFYKVHHNLFVLINLCYNPALRNSIAFNESLGANTYYRLLNSL